MERDPDPADRSGCGGVPFGGRISRTILLGRPGRHRPATGSRNCWRRWSWRWRPACRPPCGRAARQTARRHRQCRAVAAVGVILARWPCSTWSTACGGVCYWRSSHAANASPQCGFQIISAKIASTPTKAGQPSAEPDREIGGDSAPAARCRRARRRRRGRACASGSTPPAASTARRRRRARASRSHGSRSEKRNSRPATASPAGQRLHHHGGRGEQRVGDHHDARGMRDRRRIAGAVRHEHEEGDAEPGAEQHRGAEDMDELEQ